MSPRNGALIPEAALREHMATLVDRAHHLEPLPECTDDPAGQYRLGKADAYRTVVVELENIIGAASIPTQRDTAPEASAS